MLVPDDSVDLPPHGYGVLQVDAPFIVDAILGRARIRELTKQIIAGDCQVEVGARGRLQRCVVTSLGAGRADPDAEVRVPDLVRRGKASTGEPKIGLIGAAERELVLRRPVCDSVD